MTILKILLLFILFLFIFGIVRLMFVVFRFMRFLKKTRAPGSGETHKKETRKKRSYSPSDGTITLGKDDYHVE